MFFTPPILGGLGLMSFYALATRFVRPWIAVGAIAALATDLVEMHFMRDSYSELPTQAVLLGGLWLLRRGARPDRRLPGFTGLLLGATVMARIDGPLYLVAIPFVVGAAVVARRRGDPDGPAALVAAVWLVAGVALATALGLVDVRLRSTEYLHDLGGRVEAQYVGLALACIVAIGIAVWAPRRLVTWPARVARGRLPDIAAIAVAAGLFAAWFLRPHVQDTHAYAPSVHGGRCRSSTSPDRRDPPLLRELAGLALVVSRAADARRRHHRDRAAHPRGAARPARPDRARRRRVRPRDRGLPREPEHLPRPDLGDAALPAAHHPRLHPVRSSSSTGCSTCAHRARQSRRASPAVVIVGAAIAFPIHTDWPVRGDTTQFGFLGSVKQICHVVGRDGAVVVLQGATLERILPQTLRSYCDVPVAARVFDPKAPGLDRAGFARLAAAWKRDGRTLFIIGDTAERIDHIIPGLKPIAQIIAINGLYLREHITKRPDGFRPQGYVFTVARMP